MENENWDQTGMALSAERVGALLEEPTEQALYLCYDVYGFDEGGQSVLQRRAIQAACSRGWSASDLGDGGRRAQEAGPSSIDKPAQHPFHRPQGEAAEPRGGRQQLERPDS